MSLAAVLTSDVDAIISVRGVVQSFQPCAALTSKAGKPFKKRDVVLADASGEVRLTLWNDFAELEDDQFTAFPVMSVTHAKVGEFRGRNVSTTVKTRIQFWRQGDDRATEEVAQLHAWFASAGAKGFAASSKSLVNAERGVRKCLSAITAEHLGHGGVQAYLTVKATITTVKTERAWYPACTTCSKKVVEDAAGRWACVGCRIRLDRPQNRYMMSVLLSDVRTSQLVTLFDDAGRALLGTSADDVEEMQQASKAQFYKLFQQPLFVTRIFELAVKVEQREERGVDKKGKPTVTMKTATRVSAQRVHLPQFGKECARLVQLIHGYDE